MNNKPTQVGIDLGEMRGSGLTLHCFAPNPKKHAPRKGKKNYFAIGK
jgi:hypothetical protein